MTRAESSCPVTTYRERKMCGAKYRFETEDQARREQQRIRDKNGDITNVYRCPYCHYFHVGRRRIYESGS